MEELTRHRALHDAARDGSGGSASGGGDLDDRGCIEIARAARAAIPKMMAALLPGACGGDVALVRTFCRFMCLVGGYEVCPMLDYAVEQGEPRKVRPATGRRFGAYVRTRVPA